VSGYFYNIMNRKTFEEKILLRRMAKTRETLSSKAKEYSIGGSACYTTGVNHEH
jgi:hypothetical protein